MTAVFARALFARARRRFAQVNLLQTILFVHYYLLTFGAVCDILSLSRGGSHPPRESGLGWTNCWMPPLFAWGVNVCTIFPCRQPTFLKEISKNLLTNPLKCDTIRIQEGRARQLGVTATWGMKPDREAHESYIRPRPMIRPQGVRVCGI